MSNTDKVFKVRRTEQEMCPMCCGFGLLWCDNRQEQIKCYMCNGTGRIETEHIVRGHLID